MRLLHHLALCLVLLIGQVLANSKSSDTSVQLSEQNLVGQLFKGLNLRDDNGAEDEQQMKQFISDLIEQEAVIRAALDDDKEQPLPPPTKPHLLQEYNLLKSMKNQIDNPLAQLINKLRKFSGNMKKSFFEGIFINSKSKLKELNEIGQQLLKLLAESWQISINEIGPIKENEGKEQMLKELARCSAKFKWDYWQNGQKSHEKGQNYGKGGQNEKRILQLLYNLSNDGTNGLASADLKSGAKKRQQRKRRKRADDDDTKTFWQTQRFWITIFVVVAALALLIIISCFCNRNINTHRGGSSTDEEHGYGSPRYDSSPAPYHGVQMHPVQPERPTYYNNPSHGYRQNYPDNYGHGQGGYGQSSDDESVIEFGEGAAPYGRSRGRHYHSNPNGYPTSPGRYIPPAPGTEDEHHYGSGGGGACTIQ
ncbi:hypothetical protein niasHS_015595 [Heterodera schachtii]|uniref:Uncharacterized protein n=1 Tax=Heterodera schachtii TaxID=97005 RepID=A0ABD2HU10_HETSC